MNEKDRAGILKNRPHLVWVYSGRLDKVLDSSRWLETTRELRRLGWRVSLVCFGQRGEKRIQNIDALGLPTPDVYFLRQLVFHLRVVGFMLRNWSTIDILLFHQISAPWLLPLKAMAGLTRRRPLWVMDTQTVLMEDLSKGNWRDRLRGLVYQIASYMANAWADGQTTNTTRMAEYNRIPPERLWGVWPSAANLELFQPCCTARRWPGEQEPIHLVYIGVMNYERNLLSLCQAVETANQAGTRFHFNIIGDGTARQELSRFAAGTQGRIQVHPPVPHEQIPMVLAEAHVGAIPFPDEEKFRVSSPTKLFEYLAAGLPILATRIVCHTDVLNNVGYVFWVEDGSPVQLLVGLENLWSMKAELEQMGTQAALASENFTWQASARNLSDALIAHMSEGKI